MNWVGSEDPILVMMEGRFDEHFFRLETPYPTICRGVTKGT